MSYDPAFHHRRSIRLKGHDYAGGGVYFITLCAHREAIAACGGAPFGSARGATQVSPVRRGEACLAAFPAPRMWPRNYYEMIVRSPEAEQRIAEYIRMNPWKCVQELGGG